MNQHNKSKENINDFIIIFYGVPFISSVAIKMLITGESNWGPYNVPMQGFQVRMVGILFLIVCSIITYNVLVKWPQNVGGLNKVREIIKLFVFSPFFLFWILGILFGLYIHHLLIIKISFLIIILICFFFQKKFIFSMKSILDETS